MLREEFLPNFESYSTKGYKVLERKGKSRTETNLTFPTRRLELYKTLWDFINVGVDDKKTRRIVSV